MDLHSKFKSTQDTAPAPTAGDSVSMIPDASLADMLRQAMYENSPDDPDLSEEEDMVSLEDDTELNIHSMGDKLASAIDVPISGINKKISEESVSVEDKLPPLNTQTNSVKMMDIADDLDSEGEDLSEESADSQESSTNTKKYIIVAVIIIAVIGIAMLIRVLMSDSQAPSQDTSQISVVETSNLGGVQKYANDTLTATDSNTYQDSMTITKYIELIDDACLFVFEGYAENARAFVKAYVDLDTYNTYKVGARVPILYERITIDDKDYYMKVRLNL